jgi:hypothetical protein
MLRFSIAGAIMAALHIAILVYTLAQILAAGVADWTVYWRMFLALDFPVSLAVVPLTWIFPPSPGGPLSDFANFWWPLAVHGVLGTLWWYIVGLAIGERLTRLRTRAAKRRDKGS